MSASALIVGVPVVILAMIIGGIAIGAVWTATDQIVEKSDSPQLEQSYKTGKGLINSASSLQDFIAIIGIIGVIVVGIIAIIRMI